jgi:mannose-6-phosphate isomerase
VTVVAIDGVVRHYDWGSPDAIPRLLGVEPDGSPWAELWFGAHADDPSPVVEHGVALDAYVARDPAAMLGDDVAGRFGAQLPFLVKILAAERPLSIQVHPTREQAEAGYAAEDAAGIARGAPERNYRDRNHKPELLCALTRFEALCGFRPVAETRSMLADLALPSLRFLADALTGDDPLRTAFTAVLELADPAPPIADVIARSAGDERLRAARLAARHFPHDVGVLLTLLLNHVVLEPGQAIYLGAGNVHAYLRGTGVEIMAASDNVLRCGLTSKHVDAAELQRITDFRELPEPVWHQGERGFAVPVPDFRLVPLEVGGSVTLCERPAVVLCTSGDVTAGGVGLTPGRAAFVPAAAADVFLSGRGQVYVATVG